MKFKEKDVLTYIYILVFTIELIINSTDNNAGSPYNCSFIFLEETKNSNFCLLDLTRGFLKTM